MGGKKKRSEIRSPGLKRCDEDAQLKNSLRARKGPKADSPILVTPLANGQRPDDLYDTSAGSLKA